MGIGAVKLENLNGGEGRLTFCYVGVFDLSIWKEVFIRGKICKLSFMCIVDED